MKKLITLFIVAISISSLAQEPIYQLSLDDTENMSFTGSSSVTIYPVNEPAKSTAESSFKRKIKAASHISGIQVVTEKPDIAIQEIMNQVREKTGEEFGCVWNSTLEKANPTKILMGGNESTTWYFVLSPAPDGDYVLTISYLIEEKENE